jgi:hypothetical protein
MGCNSSWARQRYSEFGKERIVRPHGDGSALSAVFSIRCSVCPHREVDPDYCTGLILAGGCGTLIAVSLVYRNDGMCLEHG